MAVNINRWDNIYIIAYTYTKEKIQIKNFYKKVN